MFHQSELIEKDILAYLKQHENKELLRLLTCGSVDDGKSTLIGRLLHDSKLIYEDQLASIHKDSDRMGSAGEEVDLALLTDGLKAEREQGITIDIAYRFFSTAKRKFIIADTPGHVQYTRNMVTGASTANLAIILVDAKNGISDQTRRHSFVVSLLGIRHVVVAINKMDLVDWSEERFEEIRKEYNNFVARLDIPDLHFIPMSALKGDNVVERSENMSWYQGAPLMEHLGNVQISSDRNLVDLRFPVQWINRPDHTFRGICGTVASGVIRPGDEVMALPSRRTSRVARIVSQDGDLEQAYPPLSTTLVLEDEIDVSRGDMLVRPGNVPDLASEFDAMVVWMAEKELQPGQEYLVQFASQKVVGQIQKLRYRVNIHSLHREDAEQLSLNEIGRCKLGLTRQVAIDPYRNNRASGSFIIVDRMSNLTVGAGMVLARKAIDDRDDSASASPTETKGKAKNRSELQVARYSHRPIAVVISGQRDGVFSKDLAQEVEQNLFEQGYASVLLPLATITNADLHAIRQMLEAGLAVVVSSEETQMQGEKLHGQLNDHDLLHLPLEESASQNDLPLPEKTSLSQLSQEIVKFVIQKSR